jgi:hypothetical protein
MKKNLLVATTVALFIVPTWAQNTAPKISPSKQLIAKKTVSIPFEEFSFQIQNFKINHQGEVNNLNVKVRYSYETGISKSDYPDFLALVRDIEGFLNNYPNKTDYWEILNKNLTLKLMTKYPMLSRMTCEIQVSASKSVRYVRSSIVTRSNPRRIRVK